MDETIEKVLEALRPYQDKVLLTPMSEEEIESIQQKFPKKLPTYFKEFLAKIGLKQDFIWGIFDNITRFENLDSFLPSPDYFQFGDNGGGDYWLLKFDEQDKTIYEYDYYNQFAIVSLGKTFDDLLWEGVENVKEHYETMPLNSLKDWHVQFSIDIEIGKKFTELELGKQIEQELSQYLNIVLIKELEYVHTVVGGVKKYEGEIEIEGQKKKIKKLSHRDWKKKVSLFFDWQESVEEMQHNSTIKKINDALKKSVFKNSCGLTDYGIFDREAFRNINTNTPNEDKWIVG